MLITIEKRVARIGTCLVRRFFSQVSSVDSNYAKVRQDVQESKSNEKNQEKKALRIAMLGLPNVGKSTLVNRLVKRTVCPMSEKVHTTQTKAQAIFSVDDTQLIFVDTPGVVNNAQVKKHNLVESFKNDPKASAEVADVVAVIQDASNRWTRNTIDRSILEMLQGIHYSVPVLLVLNKIDILKQKKLLLELVRRLTSNSDYPNFSDVFMISALTGDGIDDLRNYLLDSAKPCNWEYAKHIYTDQSLENIIIQTVRAKLMDFLPQEMPYRLKVELIHCDVGVTGDVNAVVGLMCPTERISRVVAKFKKLKFVGRQAEEELRNAFQATVIVKLHVDTLSKKN